MMTALIAPRRVAVVPCSIEVERTRETLHAHVTLQGFEVSEGDEVTVRDAPTRPAFGQRIECQSFATVVRANVIERIWTRFVSYFQLTELYEVGFQPKE